MQTILWEWLTFALHWIHVVAAIAWLGFFFHTRELDRVMVRGQSPMPGAAGEAWSIRGFGIYRTVRYLSRQEGLEPSLLVWYFLPNLTLIASGYTLFSLIFYAHGELYLIDPAVMLISEWQAIGISIAGLVFSWIIYEGLYHSPLRHHGSVLLATLFVFLTALSYLYAHIFSGRGAYMQMAATLGSYVTIYFFWNVLPALRKMLNDPNRERPPQQLLDWFMMRGRHNNYLILAVVFLMMAGHFPIVYASNNAWIIIPLVILTGALIRYFFDMVHETGKKPIWPWLCAASFMVAAIYVTMDGSPINRIHENKSAEISTNDKVAAAESLISERCSMCHAHKPVWPGLSSPPRGVVLETSADMRQWVNEIKRYAVLSTAMPPANITALTLEDRALLEAWITELEQPRHSALAQQASSI